MKVNGFIPERIAYVCGRPHMVKAVDWEDVERDEDEPEEVQQQEFGEILKDPNQFIVRSAFVADSKNKQTIERFKKNLTQYGGQPDKLQVIMVENAPISGVKVLGFQNSHNQKDRSYKVLLPNGCWVGMKDDTILDAIGVAGVQPGGFLNGEFIWAVLGTSVTKLVRIGSHLHKAVIEGGRLRKLPAIKIKDLEVGGIYITPSLNCYCYLGEVEMGEPGKRVVEKLWTDCHENTKERESFTGRYQRYDTKKPKVVEKIGQIDLGPDLFVEIRTEANKGLEKWLAETKKINERVDSFYRQPKQTEEQMLIKLGEPGYRGFGMFQKALFAKPGDKMFLTPLTRSICEVKGIDTLGFG